MKRPLTAALKSGQGLPALCLAAALLLASCGSTGTPGTGTGTGGVTTGTLNATVEQPLVAGLNAQGLLRVSSATPGSVTVTVSSAPSGLTVTAGTPSASGSDTVVTLNASGSAPSGSSVKLNVVSGGKSAAVTVPVLSFKATPIHPAGAASATYAVSSIRAQADGHLLLRAPASGDDQQRHTLVRFDPASGQAEFLTFPVTGFETITSHAVAPDGRVWVAVRGVTAEGSRLIAMNAAGATQAFASKTTDTLIGLTATTDGLMWYTQYTNDSVVSLNPATGTLTPHPVDENAENLTRGTDGNLYYARFYAKPAIVQLNPTTGASRAFDVGKPDVSVPDALTPAANGTLWFIEQRTGSVWNLNPQTGKQTQVTLPVGARPTELAAAPDGTLWIADPTAGQLYRLAAGQSEAATVPALKGSDGTPNGPHALTVTPDGRLWYEASGQLVTLN